MTTSTDTNEVVYYADRHDHHVFNYYVRKFKSRMRISNQITLALFVLTIVVHFLFAS